MIQQFGHVVLKKNKDIYLIGDASNIGPPTAQKAKQQGQHLANYFNNDLSGEDYKYKETRKIGLLWKQNMEHLDYHILFNL